MSNARSTLRESAVRSYCRNFPAQFDTAQAAYISDVNGKRYIDFLAGCGALNYGHNNPHLRNALINYLDHGGIAMSMDLATQSKTSFLQAFETYILKPRKMNYRAQFTGPTGANAVEAAIKLARKVTGRNNVIGFTNAFHGCSLGALSLTANAHHRASSSALLNQVTRHPYDQYFGPSVDTAAQLQALLEDPSSGVDLPAAIILEVIQGEGGLNVATRKWLESIQQIAYDFDVLLIVDDIQAGCGRRGKFFSFEDHGISPDIVTLAKSLSGYGLPMSMVLIRPDLDQWTPGEHNGTFRGNNLAFVTATAALETYWSNDDLEREIGEKAAIMQARLQEIASRFGFRVKGCGLLQGLEVYDPELSQLIRSRCFKSGLIFEACGPRDTVLKMMPPLTIDQQVMLDGLDILSDSVAASRIKPFEITSTSSSTQIKEFIAWKLP